MFTFGQHTSESSLTQIRLDNFGGLVNMMKSKNLRHCLQINDNFTSSTLLRGKIQFSIATLSFVGNLLFEINY